MTFDLHRYAAAAYGRLNASRHGVSGRLPHGSILRGGARLRIGERFFASGPVWIEAISSYAGQTYAPLITVGRDVRSSPRLHISAIQSITIGEWCLFGENVLISDHQHGATSGEDQSPPDVPPALRALGGARPIVIGDRCHLGNNVVVLPGTVLGDGCIVGANAVVSGTFDSNTILVGAPARVVKTWDKSSHQWRRVRQ